MPFAMHLVFFDKKMLTFAMPFLGCQSNREQDVQEPRMAKRLLVIATALAGAALQIERCLFGRPAETSHLL